MVSCGMTFIKYLLFVFNLLFAISGIAILAVGGTLLALRSHYGMLVDSFWAVAILLIAVGFIVFLISFLGCCGAIRNSNVMVISFAVLLIIIFILELTAAIAGYFLRDSVHDIVQKELTNTLMNSKNDTELQEAWNILQHDLKCCGTTGPDDWKKVYGNNSLPFTCCPNNDVSDKCVNDQATFHYTNGCMTSLEGLFTEKGIIAGSIGLGVCFIQLVGVILACCLGKAIRRDYETV